MMTRYRSDIMDVILMMVGLVVTTAVIVGVTRLLVYSVYGI